MKVRRDTGLDLIVALLQPGHQRRRVVLRPGRIDDVGALSVQHHQTVRIDKAIAFHLLERSMEINALGDLLDPQFRQRIASPSEPAEQDRKSTRLNSSHVKMSYAVFCLKKKK